MSPINACIEPSFTPATPETQSSPAPENVCVESDQKHEVVPFQEKLVVILGGFYGRGNVRHKRNAAGRVVHYSHKGVDFLARHRPQLVSPRDGEIIFVGNPRSDWRMGHTVAMTWEENGEHYEMRFEHLGRMVAKLGPIKAGEPIAFGGHSGNAGPSKPHTHVAVLKNGRFINPLCVFPEWQVFREEAHGEPTPLTYGEVCPSSLSAGWMASNSPLPFLPILL